MGNACRTLFHPKPAPILHWRQQCPPNLRELMEHSPHEVHKQTPLLSSLHLGFVWTRSRQQCLPPFIEALAVPGPGVDLSRLIIILDQPPTHLKSLGEDLSRSSFCFSCMRSTGAHLYTHLGRNPLSCALQRRRPARQEALSCYQDLSRTPRLNPNSRWLSRRRANCCFPTWQMPFRSC